MKKSRGILPNAKEHLGLVILIVFISLFLIKNVFRLFRRAGDNKTSMYIIDIRMRSKMPLEALRMR